MGLIYMRISPSDGKYIGQTRFDEKIRWEDHILEAYYEKGKGYNSPLNRAIRKYGANNFSVKILEDNLSLDKLDEREIFWINYYKTYAFDGQHGYNLTRGGKGNFRILIQRDKLLELWNSKISINTIAEYFNCSRHTIKKHLFSLGITHEDLVKRRTFLVKMTRFFQNDYKEQVLSLWKEGKTVTEISFILKHERHSISNILYLYGVTKEEMEIKRLDQLRSAGKMNSIPILQFDKNNNFIKEWPSLSSAANELNLHTSNICKVLKGDRKTTGGFVFKYKENKI